MYEIWADDLLIHSDVTPLNTTKVINPHLVLEDSAAGSLEFSLPPINVGYSQDILKRMVTNIVVKENGEFLWGGRILQDSFDFWNNRKVVCEGELAFLIDSIQPPHKYDVTTDHTTIESFFYALIDIHNSQVGPDRQFEKGMVTVTDGDQTIDTNEIYRFTNYETTLECMNEKLLERLKGHLRVRHQDGKRYLDYISDDTLDTNSQVVRFGINLLDFSKNIDMTELSTVIVPRGTRLDIDDSDPRYIEGLESYLTVVDVETKVIDDKTWHTKGEIFVQNPDAVANFGRIAAVVDWENVVDKDVLYSKAEKYLKDEQYEKMTLEIQALDLKYLMDGDAPIKFQSKLRCVSEPHGMDHTFIVSKMDVDLSNPGNSLYTLGTDVKLSLTQAASRVNSDVQAQIDKIPSKSEILRAAERNAYAMISGAENSYVHFIPYVSPITNKAAGIKRIEITDGPTYDAEAEASGGDPFPDSLNRWIWTVGGLGHIGREAYQDPWDNKFDPSTGQWDDPTLNVAMTMDGQIVADHITAGHMSCDRLDGGVINGQTINGGIIKSYRGTTQSNSDSVTIEGGSLRIYNTNDRYLRITAVEDTSSNFALGGRNCAGYDSSHYYGDSNTPCPPWGICKAGYEASSGSDIRLKDKIEPITVDYAKKLLMGMKPVSFVYKNYETSYRYGLIAQEVRAILDEMGETRNVYMQHKEGEYETIEYKELIAPLIKIVQDQEKRINELERRLTQ